MIVEDEEAEDDGIEIPKEELKTYLRCNRTSAAFSNYMALVCARLPHEDGKCTFIDRSGGIRIEWADGYEPFGKH